MSNEDDNDDEVSALVYKRPQTLPSLTCQAAVHHQKGSSPYVEYNIIRSPVYCVPVLYFFLHNLPNQTVSGVQTVHDLLVPDHLRASLRDMGVMGGISMSVRQAQSRKNLALKADSLKQNHPITDLPTYYIHPCNTAEAMRAIIGERRVLPMEYLQIWIGLVGSCVSLYLPSQLALDRNQETG